MERTATPTASRQAQSIIEMIERLIGADAPFDQFLQQLLAVQCRVAAVEAGCIMAAAGEDAAKVIAYHPASDGKQAPPWLEQCQQAVGEVMRGGRPAMLALRGQDDLYGQHVGEYALIVPLAQEAKVWGAAAYHVQSRDPAVLTHCRERLELTMHLIGYYQTRQAQLQGQANLKRVERSVEVLAELNQYDRAQQALMAFVNEVASRWGADRAGIGFLEGRYVKVKALSHTEKIIRKLKLVQDIESAMEECLDQDVEVIHPAPQEATYVSRAAEELAKQDGPSCVLNLPLRIAGKPVGVVSLERPLDHPFQPEELETLRLALDLATPRLYELHHNDKWFGARFAANWRKHLATLVGPEHTWIKAAAVAVSVALAFALLVDGTYRVEADFRVEPVARRVVAAPFNGFIDQVLVEPGDEVVAGETVLAHLDSAELRLQLTQSQAERLRFMKEADLATREGKTAEAQIARAQADKAAAQARLLEHRIERSLLVAPISGVVVAGDLEEQIGMPVSTGDVLFQVAPVDRLRAELQVPEGSIADLSQGFEGQMASVSHPGDYLPFKVKRIHPVAQVEEQRNIFRVRVDLHENRPWLRPGMKGVAKVEVGERRYAWIWTRDMVNWVRMKLWI